MVVAAQPASKVTFLPTKGHKGATPLQPGVSLQRSLCCLPGLVPSLVSCVLSQWQNPGNVCFFTAGF